MHQVIGDLVREKVVPDSASVESFALDKNVFVVNNRPQSEVLHEEFEQKYNIGGNGSLLWSRKLSLAMDILPRKTGTSPERLLAGVKTKTACPICKFRTNLR